jgi:hypothetical protein
MYKRQWIAAGLLAGVAGAAVWACGPDFPSQLLDHRAGTLKATPQNSFAFEVARLLPATDKLAAVEAVEAPKEDDKAAMAKSLGLSQAQWERADAVRSSGASAEVYAQGKDLPEDLRAYIAGAVDYRATEMACEGDGDEEGGASDACINSDDPSMDSAIAYFEKILALPPEQARLRSVWAAYMLGIIHAERAGDHAEDAAVFKREREAAAKAFQLARTRAVDGGSDTQGLAVASFGEEARLHLYVGDHLCAWGAMDAVGNDCGKHLAAPDLKQAITLYAAQAGHGSKNAVQSLAMLASTLLDDDKRMAELIDSSVAQRLLVAYALARVDDEVTETPDGKAVKAKSNPRLEALVAAIEQRGLDQVPGADRLAALAYRLGRYDLALKLVDKAPGPLSSWVRAKLALQKGDLAAAATAYAEAAKAFPKADDPRASIETGNMHLVVGEQGVLALARGEYVEAMGRLYDAASAVGGSGNVFYEDEELSGTGYGNDAAYVAERVLTADELKSFIDARVPASPAPVPASAASAAEPYYGATPLGDNLRWLLARRLMRAGRYEDALPYFPASGDRRFGKLDFRAKAREFAKSVHEGDSAWSDIGKAQARFAAAKIERELGMELFGYEQDPDYNAERGDFQGGSGHSAEDLKQALVTDGERQRFVASGAPLDRRFHYRYLAADRAATAADLLPARSQAFAAVLCHASGWMLEGPPDYNDNFQGYGDPAPTASPERLRRAEALYQRYVKQGAHVSWASHFGRQCEEPDFDRARAMQRHLYLVKAKRTVRHYLLPIGGGLAALAGLSIYGFMRRRKRQAKAS